MWDTFTLINQFCMREFVLRSTAIMIDTMEKERSYSIEVPEKMIVLSEVAANFI